MVADNSTSHYWLHRLHQRLFGGLWLAPAGGRCSYQFPISAQVFGVADLPRGSMPAFLRNSSALTSGDRLSAKDSIIELSPFPIEARPAPILSIPLIKAFFLELAAGSFIYTPLKCLSHENAGLPIRSQGSLDQADEEPDTPWNSNGVHHR